MAQTSNLNYFISDLIESIFDSKSKIHDAGTVNGVNYAQRLEALSGTIERLADKIGLEGVVAKADQAKFVDLNAELRDEVNDLVSELVAAAIGVVASTGVAALM